MAFIRISIPDEVFNMQKMSIDDPHRRSADGFIQADAIIMCESVSPTWVTKYELGYRSAIVFKCCDESHTVYTSDTPQALLQRCRDAGLVS